MSCAENDHAFDTDSRRKAVDILQREKKKYQLQLFHGVAHGFAVRGNPDDPYHRMIQTLIPERHDGESLTFCRMVQRAEPKGNS